LGFACFILIMLYINFETSFDRGFTEAESIYRLDHIQGADDLAITPYILGETFKENSLKLTNSPVLFNEKKRLNGPTMMPLTSSRILQIKACSACLTFPLSVVMPLLL
jgi:hypothetical protein